MANGVFIPAEEDEFVKLWQLHELSDYQFVVGGWIEPIDLPEIGVTMYVNEAARRERRPLNLRATLLWWFYQPSWRLRTMVLGDVVIGGLLEDDYNAGEVPPDVIRRLIDDDAHVVQVRPIGGEAWYETRVDYRDYFDALLWGMFLSERWRGTDEVRVVRVPPGTH